MIRFARRLALAAILALMTGGFALASAQPGPGPKAKGKAKKADRFEDRLARLRGQLEEWRRTADSDQQVLLWDAGLYAGKADQTQRAARPYIADRTLAAAEAFFHAADHLQHLKESPGPPPPPAEDVARHLAEVYFRTRQADYFFQEIHDPSTSSLVSLARQYYQRAVQSDDRADFRGADEYGKTAEEMVRALENLAQAATLAPHP